MSEITLAKKGKEVLVPFIVNLENEETGQTETYKYKIKRLGGKAQMQVNLLLAEYRKDPNRDGLLGSAMLSEILKRITVDEGNTTDMLDLFDLLGDKELEQLTIKLFEAAKSSTVEG